MGGWLLLGTMLLVLIVGVLLGLMLSALWQEYYG